MPSSKYHAHRALILASLAAGTTRITGGSAARHVKSTIEVLRGLGTGIEIEEDGFLVTGGPYRPNRDSLSVGSSGTTLYFMTGLASLASAPVTLTGQKYFQRRPIGPLLQALGEIGIEVSATNATPPLAIQPGRPQGGRVKIDGTLSQWISGLLLVAPFATGPTVLEIEGEPNELPYVELTIRMMKRFGLEVEASADLRRFEIEPGQTARPTGIELPPDLSSAAFGLAAAALHPADVTFRGLTETSSSRIDHPEAHFVDIIAEMGLKMERDADGNVRVHHADKRLHGVDIDCGPMPDMLPVLTTMAQFADGETRFHNVEHVRLKESDRVASMLQLNRMGGDVTVEGDRLVVRGVNGGLRGAPLSSFNDHRVQMALAIAASRASGESSLTYPHAHRISYPAFLADMAGIGLDLAIEDDRNRDVASRSAQVPDGRSRAVVESVAIDQAAEVPITDWTGRWAAERPRGTAIVEMREGSTRTWTWAELDRESDRIASLLLELGVEAGETVAYQLPNWGEFSVLTVAVAKVGAIGCALMPIFREREITHALRRSKARVLVAADRFRNRDHIAETVTMLAGEEAPGLELEHVIVIGAAGRTELPSEPSTVRWHDFATATGREPEASVLADRKPAPDAPAHLFFTSGTSGEPKGVRHSFGSLTRAAFMEVEHLGLGRSDRMFVPTPLAHQTGFLYGMWLAFVLGSTQILQDVWEPRLGARALRDWEGTFIQAATPFLADLVRAVEEGEAPPSALRIFVVTGAAVPRSLAVRATRVLGASVCGAWGSTESCLAALSAPDDDPEKVWGSDGRALAGTRIRVRDSDGAELPSAAEGHLEVSSRCLFEGYLDRPDLTAAAFTEDGWYRTGDLATIDADGFLKITGRVRDVVNRGGEKIPVTEVEQLLYGHPGIEDVAIVAMPDERLGERACAFVVSNGGEHEISLDAVREYLDQHKLSRHYWPERVEQIEGMPRTPSGKIQKYVLRRRAKELIGFVPEIDGKEQIT